MTTASVNEALGRQARGRIFLGKEISVTRRTDELDHQSQVSPIRKISLHTVAAFDVPRPDPCFIHAFRAKGVWDGGVNARTFPSSRAIL